jgi:HEAT repeat protein
MTLREYLTRLAQPEAPLVRAQLAQLSDLSQADLQAVEELWPQVPLQRRRQIVQELVTLGEDNWDLEFSEFFAVALRDSDAQVRLGALEGLWGNEDPQWLASILKLAKSDPDVLVRAKAVQLLSNFLQLGEEGKLPRRRTQEVHQVLLDLWRAPQEPMVVRRRALEALAHSPSQELPDLIKSAYASAEHELVVSALYAMGVHGDPQWLPVLLRESEHPDPERRYEATMALGLVGDNEVVPTLQQRLEDDDPQVQVAAVEALGRIGTPEAQHVLTLLLEHPDERLRDAAEEVLEELHGLEDLLGYRTVSFRSPSSRESP